MYGHSASHKSHKRARSTFGRGIQYSASGPVTQSQTSPQEGISKASSISSVDSFGATTTQDSAAAALVNSISQSDAYPVLGGAQTGAEFDSVIRESDSLIKTFRTSSSSSSSSTVNVVASESADGDSHSAFHKRLDAAHDAYHAQPRVMGQDPEINNNN